MLDVLMNEGVGGARCRVVTPLARVGYMAAWRLKWSMNNRVEGGVATVRRGCRTKVVKRHEVAGFAGQFHKNERPMHCVSRVFCVLDK